MAKVSVYNIEGKEVDTIELNDAVFGVEVNVKFPAAEENRGDRKEQATQDRVQQELRSGQAAALYSLRFRETTPSR